LAFAIKEFRLTSQNQRALKPIDRSVVKEPSYGPKLRDNAVERVETTFRWSKVIDMTISAYMKAIDLSNAL
jgi:hypothetical protein